MLGREVTTAGHSVRNANWCYIPSNKLAWQLRRDNEGGSQECQRNYKHSCGETEKITQPETIMTNVQAR